MELPDPIDVRSSFEGPPPPMDFVLPGLLAGTVGAIIGPGGVGKSMVALQLGIQIAAGRDLLGIGDIPSGLVTYLSAEDPGDALTHRLYHIGKFLDQRQKERVAEGFRIQPLIGAQPWITKPEWFDRIKTMAEGRRLLLLDTLRRFHPHNENSSEHMAKVLERLESIAAETGCALLFLHHSSKGASRTQTVDRQQASRGSSVLVDNARWQAFVEPVSNTDTHRDRSSKSKQKGHVRIGVSKSNYGAHFPDVFCNREVGGVLTSVEHKVFGKRHKRFDLDEYAA